VDKRTGRCALLTVEVLVAFAVAIGVSASVEWDDRRLTRTSGDARGREKDRAGERGSTDWASLSCETGVEIRGAGRDRGGR
jgi:hypothetical protein